MSDIFLQLGVDEEDINWYHFAACRNMVTSVDNDIVFDKYESDKIVAVQTDQMCIHCPVAKLCLKEGLRTNSEGVWGGIYINKGSIHKKFNSHKTEDVWKELGKIHGKLTELGLDI